MNMSHTKKIPYSLTFLCKKPLTILSIKFTQKRNFQKSAIKPSSDDYCLSDKGELDSAETKTIQTNRRMFHGMSITSNTAWYSYDSNRKWNLKHLKPIIYKKYVHDIYSRRKKNCTDQFYHDLHNYHPNINLTI